MDESWRMDRLRGGMGGILGVQNYEGLPPEVGAFNFLKMPHAPWPVHILAVFCQFCGIFDSRGVGVIPEVLDGLRIRTMDLPVSRGVKIYPKRFGTCLSEKV